MLDGRQAFKAAFIARCIEQGYTTPEQILKQAEMVKQANVLQTLAAPITGAAKSLYGTAAGVAIPLALAAPPIVGGLGGYGLARMTDIDDTDVDEAKNREILEELRRQTARLEAGRTAKRYREQRQRSGRMFR